MNDFEPESSAAEAVSTTARQTAGGFERGGVASKPNTAFIGPFGLRAGWGILLYLLLFAVLVGVAEISALGMGGRLYETLHDTAPARAAQTAARPAPPSLQTPASNVVELGPTLLNEGLQALFVVLATAALALVERRRMRVYGYSGRAWSDVARGALWGFLALSVVAGLLRATHHLVFDQRLISGSEAYKYGALWLLCFFCVGLFEEGLFRGYLLTALTRGLMRVGPDVDPRDAFNAAFAVAGLLTSLLFFISHTTNGGETPTGLFNVFLAGVVFCYAMWRTGAIWWGIGFHMAWDWSQSFLYGVADSGEVSAHRLFATHPVGSAVLSGGAAGPEGSLFAVPILLLVLGVLHVTMKGRELPLPELRADLPAAPARLTVVPSPS
jgi:membrane protease YdiL (CAAX protease family)